MALLEIENLSTGYGEIKVLWGISLEVQEKGVTALLGANGAGKSTLLNCISGLHKTWEGKILLDGNDITGMSPHKRIELGISMVPEGRRIFPGMTVIENLMMGAYTRRAREKIDESYREVYDLFPVLKERQKQRAGTLSGGEQQMLAVARSLMARPRLLMLDEVSTGLSPVLATTVMETLAKLAETGLPMLMVEQHVEKALEISERAYVLENGRILMEGDSKALSTNEQLRRAYMGI
ncbi:ABC transporter ATP-binding protein [Candidatus Bathyarchaeota archaeon]|nr:ABC transporter ATP-binding protein [Candidatus Bathyarchaeota archaeon]